MVDGFRIADELRRDEPDHYEVLASVAVPGQYIGDGSHLVAARPVFRHDDTGVLVQVSFNNADRAPFLLPADEMNRFYDAMRAFEARANDHRLQWRRVLTPGSAMLFDNWRVLHGRTSYTGHRHLCGGYVNREDFESRLRCSAADELNVSRLAVGRVLDDACPRGRRRRVRHRPRWRNAASTGDSGRSGPRTTSAVPNAAIPNTSSSRSGGRSAGQLTPERVCNFPRPMAIRIIPRPIDHGDADRRLPESELQPQPRPLSGADLGHSSTITSPAAEPVGRLVAARARGPTRCRCAAERASSQSAASNVDRAGRDSGSALSPSRATTRSSPREMYSFWSALPSAATRSAGAVGISDPGRARRCRAGQHERVLTVQPPEIPVRVVERLAGRERLVEPAVREAGLRPIEHDLPDRDEVLDGRSHPDRGGFVGAPFVEHGAVGSRQHRRATRWRGRRRSRPVVTSRTAKSCAKAPLYSQPVPGGVTTARLSSRPLVIVSRWRTVMPDVWPCGVQPDPSTSSTSVSMPMIPSPIARPTSNDNTLFCADAMSRAYVSSVRYHSCTVTPPSTIANASLFVTARNSSSSSNSADAHGAARRSVEGDDVTASGDDRRRASGSTPRAVGWTVEGRGRRTRRRIGRRGLAAVGTTSGEQPPSAAPPAARRRARREYMTDVYRSVIRNACDRSSRSASCFTHSSAAEVGPLGVVRRQWRAPTPRSRCPTP